MGTDQRNEHQERQAGDPVRGQHGSRIASERHEGRDREGEQVHLLHDVDRQRGADADDDLVAQRKGAAELVLSKG